MREFVKWDYDLSNFSQVETPAAGLGWGTGGALGVKLALSEKTVIATLGEGAYMFGCPTTAHFVSRT